jgi:hypothetical protein
LAVARCASGVAGFSGGNEQKTRKARASPTLRDAHGKRSGALGKDAPGDDA